MEIEQKPTAPAGGAAVIGPEQLKKFLSVLKEYKSGKARTEQRILSSERWWKLRNSEEEEKETNIGKDGGFKSVSGWLHNVLVSKHADAMEAYPEPNILPREQGDRGEARKLSSIIPCILEQNRFEDTYSDVMWQKVKTGTGVYKVVWDKSKLGGLGDIAVERVNLLNIYWEPGITDIQQSRYIFHTEMYDKDVLEGRYPELEGKLKGQSFVSTKFLYDDHVPTENKHTVIDVYYHKYIEGRETLQYCKFVGDVVLYATENDPEWAMRGLYDHGMYPYVFDPLFPIEGSPCGYGYVDLCRNPQTTIDLLNTSFVKNAMVGAIPRYFSRGESSINEKEFLDLSKPIVHSASGVDDNALRPIEHKPLDGVYVNVMQCTIQELRETSGNTETSTGVASSSTQTASGIAMLQQASGKGSRDSTQGSYRAYFDIVNLCIELIRQFYDMPRQFRILGQYGAEQYITYVNQGLQLQATGASFDDKENFRLPVFDIKVSAQKKNVYTKVTQNELAVQFFQLGFFNPQMTDQALLCLEMMDFDGKDEIMQKVAQNGTIFQKLLQYMQLALTFAQQLDPMSAEVIAQDILKTTGGAGVPASGGGLAQSRAMAGDRGGANTKMNNARAASAEASQPSGGRVTRKAGGK